MNFDEKLEKACKKELMATEKKELKLKKQAEKDLPKWKQVLSAKVPEKAIAALETAFSKAFSIVFEKGIPVIDKTYDKKELMLNHQIQSYAVQLKGSRRELKRMRKMVEKTNFMNSGISMAEGTALGILGIGMPDLVVFVGILLKGIYESAIQYGYDYNNSAERYLMLCMIEAALARKEDWDSLNSEVDHLLTIDAIPSEEDVKEQMKKTANALAMDMLVLKFIQGLPIVGVLGGMANPVYYNKILKYVQLKYYKRYISSALMDVHK